MLCWAVHKLQFDDHPEPEGTLGIFSTIPQIGSNVWNLVTEIIGTFVLASWTLLSPAAGPAEHGVPAFGNAALGYAGVSFMVLAIGTSLGDPTGYAINPDRDLGPRIAYAWLLPIRGKGAPQWGYSWIPVVGPLVGSARSALMCLALT